MWVIGIYLDGKKLFVSSNSGFEDNIEQAHIFTRKEDAEVAEGLMDFYERDGSPFINQVDEQLCVIASSYDDDDDDDDDYEDEDDDYEQNEYED